MLKKQVVYVFCGPVKSFQQSTKESVAMLHDEGIPDVLVRSVMNQYEGVKIRVRVDLCRQKSLRFASRICVVTFFFSICGTCH